MASPYTNTKRKRLNNRHRKSWRLLNFGIAAVTLAVTAFAAYLMFETILRQEASPRESPAPASRIQELSDPETFMQAYIEANFSGDLLQQPQTIRLSGTLQNADHTESFTLLKKRPDKMRLTIDRGSHELSITINGDRTWRRIRLPGSSDQLSMVAGPESTQWLAQARFFDRLIDHYLNGDSLIGIQAIDWQGRSHLQASFKARDDAMVDVIIDPLTLHPTTEIVELPNGNTRKNLFGDYRNVQGISLPFQITTLLGEAIAGKTLIQTASFNSGIPDWIFELPESLLQGTSEFESKNAEADAGIDFE